MFKIIKRHLYENIDHSDNPYVDKLLQMIHFVKSRECPPCDAENYYRPITHPIKFLGFSFRLTQGGRVVMKLLPKKISHERRKLKKQVNRAKNGIMTREQVDNCFKSWEAHAKQGHTYRLRKHMKRYYKNLWR